MLFHFKTVINKNIRVIHNMGFPGGSAGKEFTCNVRDLGLIPVLGRSLGEGNSYPLQYSRLENSIVNAVAKSQTQLSKFHFTIYNIEARQSYVSPLQKIKEWAKIPFNSNNIYSTTLKSPTHTSLGKGLFIFVQMTQSAVTHKISLSCRLFSPCTM